MGTLAMTRFIATAQGTVPSLQLTDTFTEGSDTALESHTADTGQSWTKVDTGGITVTNASGTAITDSADTTLYVADLSALSSPPTRIEVDLNVDAAGKGQSLGIIFRYQDSNNYLSAYINGDAGGSNAITIDEVVGGTPNTLATASIVTQGDLTVQYKFIVKDDGNTIVADGTDHDSEAYITFSTSQFAGSKDVGLYLTADSADIDNLNIWAP